MPEAPLRVMGFLIVRGDGTMRVAKRRPNLKLDEMAFPIFVEIPRTWGRVQPSRIDVQLPEPPESRVTVGDGELDNELDGADT